MGMFSDLMGKIFAHASAPTNTTTAAASAPATPASAVPASAPAAAPAPAASDPVAAGQPAAAPAPSVDVTGILDELTTKNSEHLDWKKSIVDLMKLVGMDSGLAARKELAHDLAYTGDTGDSATMNEWLHQEVLKKLSENGGKIPKDLLG